MIPILFKHKKKTWLSLSQDVHQMQHFGSVFTSSLAGQTNSRKKADIEILMLAVCAAWHIHSSPLLECVRSGSLSVPELQRQRLSPLIDHAFVPSAKECQVKLLWPSTGLVLSHILPHPLGLTEAGKPVANPPPTPAMRVTLG